MLKEFKEFAMQGNLVDIAVAFVMGAAFKEVVTAFTGGIVSPLVGLIFKSDFKALRLKLKNGVVDSSGKITGEIWLEWGTFLTYVVDFIIVAFVMFVIVKAINKLKKKEVPVEEVPKGPSQEQLLTEIRDLLKK